MMKLVVLSCLMAAASASVLAGIGSPLLLGAPWIAPSNYRGPLSLAPGQPANVLALDGRPLDTLDVNLDRSAHLTAKALEGGIHILKKRSVAPLIGPIAPIAPISRIAYHGSPLIAPRLAVSAPIVSPIGHYGHLLKKRSVLPLIAPIAPIASIGRVSLTGASLIAPNNYRGPLSLAPGQPANILALDGRPLDTLDVNLDRSAHLTARALEGGIHLLKKRSVAPLIAPIAQVSSISLHGSPLIAPGLAAPTPIVSPIASIGYAASPLAHAW